MTTKTDNAPYDLPFSCSESGFGISIYDGKGYKVCGSLTLEESAFICKRVNNHEALKKALAQLIKDCDIWNESVQQIISVKPQAWPSLDHARSLLASLEKSAKEPH